MPNSLSVQGRVSRRVQSETPCRAGRILRMKPDLTTKVILVVIAVLLGAIAVKVYVFPGVKAQDITTAQPQNQQVSKPIQQTASTAPDSARSSAGPSKSEAAKALTEWYSTTTIPGRNIDCDVTVGDLECRNTGGNTFDCQVLYTFRTGDVNREGTREFIFTKLGGKWRAHDR